MKSRPQPSFLWPLGALLLLYLVVPVGVFLGHGVAGTDLSGSQDGLGDAIRTSLVSATLATGLVLVTGIPLARVLAASTAWWARALGVVVQLPLALPPVMSGIVLIYVVGPYTYLGSRLPLTESLAGVVVAQVFVAAPFLLVTARSAFRAINQDVDDVAATLGLTSWRRFLQVDLPLAAPGIVAGALMCWLRALGEYGATSLLAYHPTTLPVYTAVQFSGDGLTGTTAPTLVALGIAASVLVVAHLPLPGWRRHARLPVPHRATPPAVTTVTFDVDQRVADFHLQVAYAATSPRLAILGPSGSGKTLLLKALSGLHRPAHVELGGLDVSALPPERRRVGYVTQDRLLFEHRSVWRNATLAPRASREDAAWWVEELGLTHLVDRSPLTLSGGERQRACLLQALASRPRILLLDEPFSALDTPTRTQLVARLRGLQRELDLSSVLVTHDPREALALAQEVIVLDRGRILQAGPIRDVFARPTSPRVAHLLGQHDILPATCQVPGEIRLGEHVRLPEPAARVGEHYLVRVPPVAITFGAGSQGVTIVDVVDSGVQREVSITWEGHRLMVPTGQSPLPGATTVHCRTDLLSWWRTDAHL